MWQAWQALANNSSPVDSVKRKPVLREAGGRERVSSSACAPRGASEINASPTATAAERYLVVKSDLAGLPGFERIALHPDDAFMQPRNGIER
jgi:hypothetical protein